MHLYHGAKRRAALSTVIQKLLICLNLSDIKLFDVRHKDDDIHGYGIQQERAIGRVAADACSSEIYHEVKSRLPRP